MSSEDYSCWTGNEVEVVDGATTSASFQKNIEGVRFLFKMNKMREWKV